MAWRPLPLTGEAYGNVDEVELDGVSPLVVDAYVNELEHTVKRPGLQTWAELGTDKGIDGLFWWDHHNVLISVSGGRVFKHTDFTGTWTEITGATLAQGMRMTFTPNRLATALVMANGGPIIHTDLNALTTMADIHAPTTVSHVAYLDGYILANLTGTNTVHFSDPLTFTAWEADDIFNKAGRPDRLLGVFEGWSEMVLVGKQSVEFWFNDGQTPFQRRANGLIPSGTTAVYTFAQVGNNWMYLDNKRRFVRLDNRTPTSVSFPYHKVIQAFRSVDDAVSDNIEVSGFPLYVTNFPLGKKTLVYNYQKQSWCEWGYWNLATAEYNRWRGNCYAYAVPWNLHLVGDYTNGKIYKMSKEIFTDDGNPIRTMRRTGFISHGTSALKTSNEIVFRLKRGIGNPDIFEPRMTVRYRNHSGGWLGERVVSLGEVGDHVLEGRLKRLGEYRYRQYEIVHSDPSDFILMEAYEDVHSVDA